MLRIPLLCIHLSAVLLPLSAVVRGEERRGREERKKKDGEMAGVLHGPCRLSNLAKGSFLAFLVPPRHPFSQRTLDYLRKT
ncbi:hypothetical protein Q7C36_010864 [Tachysurus vachellii]|uniref:Secreted protein n=1 Tax=Tachysurus vachellii TaxID=175792 RepID=A0AA88MWF3_TACVA|nr:hypothetical protein Q7C36_010864 [Tachysurus vachellii]